MLMRAFPTNAPSPQAEPRPRMDSPLDLQVLGSAQTHTWKIYDIRTTTLPRFDVANEPVTEFLAVFGGITDGQLSSNRLLQPVVHQEVERLAFAGEHGPCFTRDERQSLDFLVALPVGVIDCRQADRR